MYIKDKRANGSKSDAEQERSCSMKETLEKILQIEAECEEIKKDSRHEAKKIKDSAIDSGKELVKSKKREANKRAYEIIDNANQNADALIARVKQEINVEYKDLTATAERNMKKAAEHVMERIVEGL